ncbi:MAG TPA: hypothetical protein VFQ88_11090 [Nevskiaceae bacterium]|nr:hypothetical protein [Nevskiaceae bacterium]
MAQSSSVAVGVAVGAGRAARADRLFRVTLVGAATPPQSGRLWLFAIPEADAEKAAHGHKDRDWLMQQITWAMYHKARPEAKIPAKYSHEIRP